MQNIAVNKYEVLENKKKDFELAKKDSLETQNNVQVIELEIEAIKVKGQFEETFLRFPHIAEQVFETLDIQSLSKCQEVGKCWQNFIFETKPFFRLLENYTSIPRYMLKKSLKDYDFQTIQKLAHCATICHQKAVNAIIPFGKPPLTEHKGPSIFYYILFKEKLSDTQFLLAKLMILNKMNKSCAISTLFEKKDISTMGLSKLINDARSGKFGKGYTSFKDMLITIRGKWGTIWSWSVILNLAVAQNHMAICKLIFKQIQDRHPNHEVEKSFLNLATLFGHRDMCEFLIEIQGIDHLNDLNWGNPIQMAELMGHTEICNLFENFMQKQK